MSNDYGGLDWNTISTTKAMDEDTLRRSMMVRLDLAIKSGEQIVEDYRIKVAETFLLAGITLIPSDHLQDHQYVVSRGVYDAAMKLCKAEKREVGP